MSSQKLKIAFYSMDATGHLNSAIGMAQAMAARGHEIIFLTSQTLTAKVKACDFQTFELKQTNDAEASDAPARDLGKIAKKDGHLSGESSLFKVRLWGDRKSSVLQKFFLQSIDYQPQIEEICLREGPISCFIMDHFFFYPFLAKHNIPWISLMSIAPHFLYNSPDLAPALSGYSEKDRDKWDEFRAALNEISNSYEACQNELNKQFGFVANGEYTRNVFYNVSPVLNLYQYPKELDFQELQSKFDNLCSVDAFIRHEPGVFELPECIRPNREAGERLIFLSMGSMGSFDVDLMKRLTDTLAKLPHKFIVSKGPLGSEYSLPENMWGEDSLPQTKILPLVDLVITHGGNNSLTESFSFGCKMLVMPLFGDQYDNAQRVQETGYGLRIEPYDHTPEELLNAVEQLLADNELTTKLLAAKERIQNSNSKEKACERIEQRLREFNSSK